MKTPTSVFMVTTILVMTGSIQAQDPPSWNRKAEAISVQVVPVEGSFFDVNCYVSIDASDLTEPVDLSTELELRVNGVMQYIRTFQLTANPSTHADCSGLNCGSEPCFCTPPPAVCECGPIIISTGGPTPLMPGDEIVIILRPAPGAAPDRDESDDQLILPPWEGETLFWNRRIENLQIVPSSVSENADVFFDVTVCSNAQVRYSGSLNLDAVLELKIDGVLHSSQTLDLTNDWTTCNAVCLGACVFEQAVPAGSCATVNPYGCICVFDPVQYGFKAVPVDPGGTVTVTLIPVPGSLPPLPGFPGDDEEEEVLCPWDCGNGDLFVGIEDFLALLAQWNQIGSSCDFNGDGVNINDFLELLANWGPCFDV